MIMQIKGKLTELTEEVCRRDEDAHVPLGTTDMKEFDKRPRKYWRYVGSLSTPPCTENVIWYILGKVLQITHFLVTYTYRKYSLTDNSPAS